MATKKPVTGPAPAKVVAVKNPPVKKPATKKALIKKAIARKVTPKRPVVPPVKKKRGGNPNRSSAAKIKGMLQRADAMKWRQQGLSFSEIGEKIGITKQRVHQYITQALDEMRSDFKQELIDIRDTELQTLDAMQRHLWRGVESGDPKAVEKVLKIIDTRAKFLGTYAPEKVALTDTDGKNIAVAGGGLSSLLKAGHDAGEVK